MTKHDKMSIARVIARLNVGGPAIQAIMMTADLRRRGYQTLLVTGEVALGEASMEYLAEANNVTPVKITSMSREISLVRDIRTLRSLISIFREQRPTIVHTHTAKAGTLGRIAAVLTGVPIRVHTFHGHVFSGYFSPAVTRLFLTIERFLAKHTDCIIAISDSQRKELVEVYKVAPEAKVVTIPLGFDLDPFLGVGTPEGSFRTAIGATPSQPLVGWVGRLTAIKAPFSLIDCAAAMRRHSLVPRFVMIGDGELRQECSAKIAREGLHDVVSLAGSLRELPAVYSDLDFVVATSLNEGTPVALLEAMASGKAIISTDVGGVRDLMVGRGQNANGIEVFENGILVECGGVKLVNAIEYLLRNPGHSQTMGQAGREFVKERFSQSRLTDDLAGLYESLARTKLCSTESAAVDKAELSLISTDERML
jgi:glycosyltransferase involved in cell wall biosynthesis